MDNINEELLYELYFSDIKPVINLQSQSNWRRVESWEYFFLQIYTYLLLYFLIHQYH